MTAILAIGMAGMAVAMIALGSKLSSARKNADDAGRTASELSRKILEIGNEYGEYRIRTRMQLSDLRGDIASLEKDLSECSDPGSRRSRLERLLSKASDDPDSDDTPGVH